MALFLASTGLAPEMIAGARDSPMWPDMEAVAPTLAYDDAVRAGGRLPAERLAALDVPVLALAGGAGPAWTREAARATADAAPEGAYRCLPDQTHMVDPDVLAPEPAEFLGG